MPILSMVKGDDRVLAFDIVDDEGAPLDLTGFDIVFTAKIRPWSTPSITKSLGSGIEAGVTTGEALVTIDAVDTASLNPVTMGWALKLIDINDKTYTVARGRLRIE